MSTSKTFGQVGAKPALSRTMQDRINRLKASRPVPVSERHLTPGGSLETDVKRSLANLRERQIRELSTRRINTKAMVEKGFSKAKRNGIAKRDFGRSR